MQHFFTNDTIHENMFILLREIVIDLSHISIIGTFGVWYSQRCIDATVTEIDGRHKFII
jgi:hypothetical protein